MTPAPGIVRAAALASVITGGLWAAACGEGRADATAYAGTPLTQPRLKPEFTLTTTAGAPFDFRAATDGYVTLLFFGYTSCPDVCPVQLTNLAAVLHKLPPDIASGIRVVFVTTDPDRDTPERLQAWLHQFDTGFIGLRGPIDTVNQIQRRIGLPPAVRQEPEAPGEMYTVGHAAQVIAYSRDNLAHFVYPFGTRQADWARDLPRLVKRR